VRALRTLSRRAALLAVAAAVLVPSTASAAADPCGTSLTGTAGARDLLQASAIPEAGTTAALPAAPARLIPPGVAPLRGTTDTYNSRYAFAARGGNLYVRHNAAVDPAGWRTVPLPPCLAGKIMQISADDDELIAIDALRDVYVMDNALKGPAAFNWTNRWGLPFWRGAGRTLPRGVLAWSWSVLSPAEDRTWSDPAGNAHVVGADKVSHIWALRTGGQRLTFMDPWLAPDDSYEMCGPDRGRFRAVNLSASGSTVFVIGARGDLYTRLFDFDLSGSDPAFFHYTYDRQPHRAGVDTAPIQLPSAGWVHQPKVPGAITSAISVAKTGTGSVHRVLRVEGRDARGRDGYWQKDVTARTWRFHRTGGPLTGRRLLNPQRDTSRVGRGAAADVRFSGGAGAGLGVSVEDFNVHCSPARLVLRAGGKTTTLLLHSADALRGNVQPAGLAATPRAEYGAVEVPAAVLAHRAQLPAAIKGYISDRLHDQRFTTVDLTATTHALTLTQLGLTLRR
jgi:hypothetical protein